MRTDAVVPIQLHRELPGPLRRVTPTFSSCFCAVLLLGLSPFPERALYFLSFVHLFYFSGPMYSSFYLSSWKSYKVQCECHLLQEPFPDRSYFIFLKVLVRT